MRDYRKLRVWRSSFDLTRSVYRATEQFPAHERFELAKQMRRAAVSIPSNIAEGSGRESPRDFVRFLRIAYGSGCELETQLLLADALGYERDLSLSSMASQAELIRRQLYGLIKTIEES